MDAITQQAFNLAVSVRDKAHAPYSKYKVGAAVKAKGQAELIAGCNVENACYPAGVCAEHNAINRMVATYGPDCDVEFVVVITSNKAGAAPCGICRQVLSEFSAKDTKVYLGNPDGIQQTTTVGELLPHAYNRKDLEESN